MLSHLEELSGHRTDRGAHEALKYLLWGLEGGETAPDNTQDQKNEGRGPHWGDSGTYRTGAGRDRRGRLRRENPRSGEGKAAHGAASRPERVARPTLGSPGSVTASMAGTGSLALTKPSRVARSCSHSSSSSLLYSGCVFSACSSLLSNSVLSLLLGERRVGTEHSCKRASPGHRTPEAQHPRS